ncbi:MAG: hypothetical protein HN509_05365 [Halobacteriovoraceae bacterium]|jgi:hypothetical protein|nr:hypothetical protein [Halobacteriovoraceae bacterium]
MKVLLLLALFLNTPLTLAIDDFTAAEVPTICTQYENNPSKLCGTSYVTRIKAGEKEITPCYPDTGDKCRFIIVTAGHVAGGDSTEVCLQGKCHPIKIKRKKKEFLADNLHDVAIFEIEPTPELKSLGIVTYGNSGLSGLHRDGTFLSHSNRKTYRVLPVASNPVELGQAAPFVIIPEKLREKPLPFFDPYERRDPRTLLFSGAKEIPSRIVPGMSGAPFLKPKNGFFFVDGVVTQYNRVRELSYISDNKSMQNLIERYLAGERGIVKNFAGKKVEWKYSRTGGTYRVLGNGKIFEIPNPEGNAGGEGGDGGGPIIGDGGGPIIGDGGGPIIGDGGGEAGDGGDPDCYKNTVPHDFIKNAESYLKKSFYRPGIQYRGKNAVAFKMKLKSTGQEEIVYANWESLAMIEKLRGQITVTPLEESDLNLNTLMLNQFKRKDRKSFGTVCRYPEPGGKFCSSIFWDQDTETLSVQTISDGKVLPEFKMGKKDQLLPWYRIKDPKTGHEYILDVRGLFMTNLQHVYGDPNKVRSGEEYFKELRSQGRPKIQLSFRDKDRPIATYPVEFSF